MVDDAGRYHDAGRYLTPWGVVTCFLPIIYEEFAWAPAIIIKKYWKRVRTNHEEDEKERWSEFFF